MKKNLSKQFTMFFNKNDKYVKITSYQVTPNKSFSSDVVLGILEQIAKAIN